MIKKQSIVMQMKTEECMRLTVYISLTQAV